MRLHSLERGYKELWGFAVTDGQGLHRMNPSEEFGKDGLRSEERRVGKEC